MSTPNPLAPQGSLLEQQARSKSSLQIAALIVALHVVGLGGFLILGCDKEKKKNQADAGAPYGGSSVISPDTNLLTGTTDPMATAAAPVISNTYSIPPVTNFVAAPPVDTHPPVPPITSESTNTAPMIGASEYKVKSGDNPAKIAKAHGVSTKALMDANPGVDPKKLKPGMTLQIPSGGTSKSTSGDAPHTKTTATETADSGTPSGDLTEYTVKGGDNLSKIARKYGTTVKALKATNGLKSSTIKVGDKLKVPAKAVGVGDTSAPVPSTGGSTTPSTTPTTTPRSTSP